MVALQDSKRQDSQRPAPKVKALKRPAANREAHQCFKYFNHCEFPCRRRRTRMFWIFLTKMRSFSKRSLGTVSCFDGHRTLLLHLRANLCGQRSKHAQSFLAVVVQRPPSTVWLVTLGWLEIQCGLAMPQT